MTEPAPSGLLVTLCRADRAEPIPEEALAPLRDRVWRAAFVGRAHQHGILGLVLAALQRSATLERLPAEAVTELGNRLRRLRRRAGLWLLERNRVLAALEGRGLRPVLVKGAGLCGTLYADPVERQVRDLDLLVPADALDAAVAVVAALGYPLPSAAVNEGYRRHHYHLPFYHPSGFAVELHWALSRPDSPFYLDPEAFLRNATSVRDGDGTLLPAPSREDQLLHVAFQNALDGFPFLARPVDLDRMVRSDPEMDWERVRHGAAAGGLTPALALSLELAATILGTPVPAQIREALRPGRLVRFHLALLRPEASLLDQCGRRSWAAGELLNLWLQADAGRRWHAVTRLLRGERDPLGWLWRHEAPAPPSRRGLLSRASALGKLAAMQAALYLAALRAAGTGRAPRTRRFWRGAPVPIRGSAVPPDRGG
jgi:hypothetical protein